MFHTITPNQSPCSSKSSLTMNSQSFFFLSYIQKILNNTIRRSTSINKIKIVMSKSVLNKPLLLVCLIVKSDHSCDPQRNKQLTKVLRSSYSKAFCICPYIGRTSKSQHFAWNNPVSISIFYSLVELVLLDIESPDIEPAQLNCGLKSAKTVQNRAFISATAVTSVSIVDKRGQRGKWSPSLLS